MSVDVVQTSVTSEITATTEIAEKVENEATPEMIEETKVSFI